MKEPRKRLSMEPQLLVAMAEKLAQLELKAQKAEDNSGYLSLSSPLLGHPHRGTPWQSPGRAWLRMSEKGDSSEEEEEPDRSKKHKPVTCILNQMCLNVCFYLNVQI